MRSSQKPELTALQFSLAQLYLQAENSEQAEAILQTIIKEKRLEPDGLKARTGLAMLKNQQEDVDAARTLLDEVLAENPQDGQALMLKGRIELQQKQYTEAVATFRSVLKGQPDSAEALTLLAAAHQGNGETELALENLSRAVEVKPENIEARLRLAQFLAASGDIDGSLEQVNAALGG